MTERALRVQCGRLSSLCPLRSPGSTARISPTRTSLKSRVSSPRPPRSSAWPKGSLPRLQTQELVENVHGRRRSLVSNSLQAITAAWVRLSRPSLDRMPETWFLTVFSARDICSPICRLVRPSAM